MSKQAGRMSQGANDFLTPYAPTIGTATDVGTERPFNNGAVSVTFTPTGPNAAIDFTVTASTGQTATGASSPIIVQGIASGATPTFTVTGRNAVGVGPASAASNAVTVTTVPQAPSLGAITNSCSGRAFNNGLITVAMTANATGGKAITGYYAQSNAGQTVSGASSPLSVTGLTGGTSYTFQGRVSNANGNSDLTASSGAVTATTVPSTPSAPSASSPSAGVDNVSWTAPSNGGSAITNYYWTSSDGKSGNTASTSVSVTQEQGTAQTYNVRADNACGSSATSGSSNSVTTVYSFVPYSFVPYSFVPYSFTPFSAFGAFGAFSAFGAFGAFSAFGAFGAFGAFSAFGAFGAFAAFGAFGAFAAYTFAPNKSVGVDTLVLTTEGYTIAKNLKVGDVLVSADIPGLGVNFTKEQMEAWTQNPEGLQIVADKETTIMNIGISTATVAVMIGNELYSGTHYMLTQRNGVAQMIKSEDLLTTDKLWSTDTNSWIDITELVITSVPHEVVSINCEPNDMFFTDHFLVYDGYQIEY